MTHWERDHYDWDVACPRCGLKGSAIASELAYPDKRGLLFRVEKISLGFCVSKPGKLASDTEIVCIACGVVV